MQKRKCKQSEKSGNYRQFNKMHLLDNDDGCANKFII